MKISIFTLCDYAQNNQGKLSIIGTFNKISSDTFPFTYNPTFCLVCKVVSNYSVDTQAELSVIAPDGSSLITATKLPININVSGDKKEEQAANLIVNMAALTFNIPGKYQFRIKVDSLEASQDLYLVDIKNQ